MNFLRVVINKNKFFIMGVGIVCLVMYIGEEVIVVDVVGVN